MTVHPQLDRMLGRMASLVLLFSFVVLLFYRGLNDPDEGRYAEIPREMVAGHNWMEMRLLGFRYYEKPPLAYWVTAAAIRLFGRTDAAARVPLLPVMLASISLGFFLAWRHWGKRRAFITALVMSTGLGFYAGMALLLPDNFLLLWFALTCVLLFEAFQSSASARKRYACFLGAAAAAYLGAISKGLVAVVLPGGIVFLWLLWERRLSELWGGPLLAGGLLFLALFAPTAWLIERHNPGFVKFFYVAEHLSRFTGTRADQGHPEPIWFFLKVLPAMLVPWTFFLIRMGRTMAVRRVLRTDSLSRFLLVWGLVVFAFFSLSSGKLMSYIMPAMIPFGLLIGRWGVEEPLDGSRADRWMWRGASAFVPLLGVAVIAFWLIAFRGLFPEDLVRPSAVTGLFLLPAAVLLAAMPWSRALRTGYGLALVTASIFFGLAFLGSPLAGKEMNVLLRDNSSLVFKELARQLKPEDQIVKFCCYRPSLAFYANRIPWLYQLRHEMRQGMTMEPDRPGWLADSAALFKTRHDVETGRWFVAMCKDCIDRFAEERIAVYPTPVAENRDLILFEIVHPEAESR